MVHPMVLCIARLTIRRVTMCGLCIVRLLIVTRYMIPTESLCKYSRILICPMDTLVEPPEGANYVKTAYKIGALNNHSLAWVQPTPQPAGHRIEDVEISCRLLQPKFVLPGDPRSRS